MDNGFGIDEDDVMKKSTSWAWGQSNQRESVRTMANFPAVVQSGPGGQEVKRHQNSNSEGQKLFAMDESEVDGEDIVE